MTQHVSLAPERWARFGLDQQIVQIGAEMHRALRFLTVQDLPMLRDCYERAIQLADLTAEVNESPHLRRELLLWRGFVADLSGRDVPDPDLHKQAMRVLLQLHPEAAKQIPLLGL